MKSIYRVANSIFKNEVEQNEIYPVASSIVSLGSVFGNHRFCSVFIVWQREICCLRGSLGHRRLKATAGRGGRRRPRGSGIGAGPCSMVTRSQRKQGTPGRREGQAQIWRSWFGGQDLLCDWTSGYKDRGRWTCAWRGRWSSLMRHLKVHMWVPQLPPAISFLR